MIRSISTLAGMLLGLFVLLAATSSTAAAADNAGAAGKLHVAIITGGHDFDESHFLKLFQGHDDIAYEHLAERVGGEPFDNIDHWPYDVIVLYNFDKKISPRQQENFLKLLDKGIGLVVLHHASAAYLGWPEFEKIAGVRYHLTPWERDGVKMPASGYKHGLKFMVHIADAKHPITRGLKDFEILDETYCRTSMDPAVRTLLTTDEPTSDKSIGWVKTYRSAKVCYLQSGHDESAYNNPTYRTLVIRAIRWTAGRLQ